jgi:hypothetical protein
MGDSYRRVGGVKAPGLQEYFSGGFSARLLFFPGLAGVIFR